MYNLFIRNKSFIFILVFTIGILGVILFFPLKIDNRYSCLFHCWSKSNELKADTNRSSIPGNYSKLPSINAEANHINHDLLKSYISSYAFLWWGSFVWLTGGIYLRNRLSRKKETNENVTKGTMDAN
jgi:hypothetical protein